MRRLIFALLLIAFTVLFFWSQQFGTIWQYLFLLRVPIFMSGLLLALPFVANYLAPSMLKNLFSLTSRGQVATVVTAAVMAGMAAALCGRIILEHGVLRYQLPVWQSLSNSGVFLLAVALGTPIIAAIVILSGEIPLSRRLYGLLHGGIISGLLLSLTHIGMQLAPPRPVSAWITRQLAEMPGAMAAGYWEAQQNALRAGHLAAAGFLLGVLIIYAAGFFAFRPRIQPRRFQAPPLFFLLILVMMLTLFFSAATFFLDLLRIPVVLIFLLISFITYGLFNVDHFYELKPLPDPPPGPHPDSPANEFLSALAERLARQKNPKRTLVVVCASGGGIQAAGWMTMVLTGLQEILGEAFPRAIGLISSVSGGSVGTLHYLDRIGPNGYPERDELPYIFDSATKESLDATSWGLAYPDFWRLIGLPFLPPKLLDRGTVIEVDWKSTMKQPETAFSHWRVGILQGKLPVPVFNATLVEDGRRFLLSPMSFGENIDSRYVDFHTLYESHDIQAATAARLSATFPYVTPICRNDQGEPVYHIADGGYFDNFGVFTAVEWLDRWVLPAKDALGIERLLFLQINAFPEEAPLQSGSRRKGWVISLAGPLLTLFRVRNSTQIARNRREVKNLQNRCAGQVEFANFSITFPKMPSFTDARDEYTPPLSWKLTQAQKQALRQAWQLLAADPQGAVAQLMTTWRQWHR